MPNQNRKQNQNLSPQEQRRLLKEYEKKKFAEIEKETRREIFAEKYKDKIFKWTKWGCVILIFIIVFAVAMNIIVPGSIIKFPSPQPTPTPEKPKEFRIETEEVKLLSDLKKENVYDVIARIKNYDPDFGVSKLNYKFILKDFLGNVVGEQKGQSYILPQQSRYIIELGIATDRRAEVLEFEAKPEEIQKFKEFENPQGQIKISGQNFSILDDKTKVWADVHNESIFGFGKTEIDFILYDNENNIIGVNYTNINDFAAGTKRYVSALWDYVIKDQINRIELEANVNVYESGAFMGQYREGQVLEY
ncbi:MAG: hypothetical protein AB1465_04755 [Patescibacteria group bacterium]